MKRSSTLSLIHREKKWNSSRFSKIIKLNKNLKLKTYWEERHEIYNKQQCKKFKSFILDKVFFKQKVLTIVLLFLFSKLTHFEPLFISYTPWEHQKTSGVLMFFESMERKYGK